MVRKRSQENTKEKKVVRERSRYLRISPQKLNLVAREVRGLTLLRARTLLRFLTKKGASFLDKSLQSASVRARDLGMEKDKLYVSRVEVNGGPILKRGRAVSRGTHHPIYKRTSHLLIELTENKEDNDGTKS